MNTILGALGMLLRMIAIFISLIAGTVVSLIAGLSGKLRAPEEGER
jgi:hypothetical protein